MMRTDDYRAKALSARARLLQALPDPRGEQDLLLLKVLRANGSTEFAREHGLDSVRDIDAFRRVVPIRTHEQMMPWIERAIAGEPNVLTADAPVAYFSSSGTTGREKHIPVTQTYLRTCFLPFYYAGFARVLEHFPSALAADDHVLNLWQDPSSRTGTTSGGQLHLGPSQLDFQVMGDAQAVGPGNRAPWGKPLQRFAGLDPWDRAYAKLRLAADADIRCVIGVNPAIIAAVPYQLRREWPRLMFDLRFGTLCGEPVREPKPRLADRLEELADLVGTVTPAMLWPKLRLILAWNTALASLYLPHVSKAFGEQVTVWSAPIGSCEGPAALPIDQHPTAGPLFTPGCLYEFIPAEEEITPASDTLLADELAPGREYHLLLTHIGGLYRCAVNDIVKVVDILGRTPRIEYAGRSAKLDGLSEPQLVRALGLALSNIELDIGSATCRLVHGGPSYYEVAIAGTRVPSQTDLDILVRSLDFRLKDLSMGYRMGRAEGRLGEVHVSAIHPDAFLREWERAVRSGQRPPRVKDRVFQLDSGAWERLCADPAPMRVPAGQR
jgi:hypothetical protein